MKSKLNKRAVVLMSGGIDSAACANFFKEAGYDVEGLYVDFGQDAAKEEKKALAKQRKELGIDIDIFSFRRMPPIGAGESKGRNAFLICSAYFARAHAVDAIGIGIHSGTDYYDCSPAFFKKMEALVKEQSSGTVSLVAPFLDWQKFSVMEYFFKIGLSLDITYSCEAGILGGCGECLSCRDRESFYARR